MGGPSDAPEVTRADSDPHRRRGWRRGPKGGSGRRGGWRRGGGAGGEGRGPARRETPLLSPAAGIEAEARRAQHPTPSTMDSPVHHADAPAPPLVPAPSAPMQREHDSIDDFEHLDRDASPPRHGGPAPVAAPAPAEADLLMLGADPVPHKQDPVSSVQSFLDTEREELVVSPAHVSPHVQDDPHFSDSREELSPAPSDDSLPDAIENFVSPPSPAHVPVSVPEPAPVREESPVPAPIQVPAPAPVQVPAPAPVPVIAKVETPPPTPVATSQSAQPLRPVTEAEAIFCQMGLGMLISYIRSRLIVLILN